MIFISLIYHFFQMFYGYSIYTSYKRNTAVNMKKLQNNLPNEIKKNDSNDSLDSYFESSQQQVLSYKRERYEREGDDERFPSFFNENQTYTKNTSYPSYPSYLEEDTTLQRLKLNLWKYTFLSRLNNPNVSRNTKIDFINKYYRKSAICKPDIRKGGLMDDYEW